MPVSRLKDKVHAMIDKGGKTRGQGHRIGSL